MKIYVVRDDLTGKDLPEGTPVENVDLVYKGKTYRLDLGPDSAKKFFDQYIQKATEVNEQFKYDSPLKTTRTRAKQDNADKLSKEELAELRLWATGEGIAVADRGRVAAKVVDAWKASKTA